MNGPVASVGSIPNFSNNNGTNVPIKDAIIITEINDIETVKETFNCTPNKK